MQWSVVIIYWVAISVYITFHRYKLLNIINAFMFAFQQCSSKPWNVSILERLFQYDVCVSFDTEEVYKSMVYVQSFKAPNF